MTDAVEWGTTPGGDVVRACTIADGPLTATVLTYGATLERLLLRAGEENVDVVLGFDSLQARLDNPESFLGAVVGPFANRIAGARMEIDGSTHELTANDGENCLHGGAAGTDSAVWAIEAHEADRLVLSHRVDDGEGGFPGPIDVRATYTVRGDTLTLELDATTGQPTAVNLSHHAYLNLAGGGSTDDHTVRVPAPALLEVDAAGIPTRRMDVADAGLDLRRPTGIGELRRRDVPLVRTLGGVDIPYLPDPASADAPDGTRLVVELVHPPTGRRVEVFSDQPCLQVYTAIALTTTAPGHDGRLMRPGDGVALEPQRLPDSPNQEWMPSPVLRPGERYTSTISWRFGQD